MKDVIVFCSDLESLKNKLKEDGHYNAENDTYTVNHTLTPIISKDNTSLSYVRDFSLDLNNYTMLEILGDYDDMFADTIKDDKYKSVYPYDIEQFYMDENNNQVGYFMPKKIGVFYD